MQTLTRLDYTPAPCPTGKARKYTSEERQRWRTPNTIQQPVLWLVAHALGGEIGLDPTSDDIISHDPTPRPCPRNRPHPRPMPPVLPLGRTNPWG